MKKYINIRVIFYIVFLLLLSYFANYLKFHNLKFNKYSFPSITLSKNHNFDILNSNYYVKFYDNNNSIDVTAKLKISIISDTLKSISLNLFDNLKISRMLVNNNNTYYIHKNNLITIYLQNKDKILNIEANYSGTPKNLGVSSFGKYKFNNYNYVYTINEPYFVSTWLLCKDDNADKTNLEMTIEIDTPYIAISNGRLIKFYQNSSKNIYYWKSYYSISPYLISIYAGKYNVLMDSVYSVKNKHIPIYFYSLPHNTQMAYSALQDTKKVLIFFENTFGEYPFINDKYSVTEIFWNNGAIENQTAVGIGEIFMTNSRQSQLMLIHELAHQWWGNSVTVDNWNDIWLSEGLARYSEALAVEYFQGKNAYFEFMNSLKEPFWGRLSNPQDNLFSRLVYNKGAWIFHMLRMKLGDTLFFNFLRAYYNKFKYSTVNTNSFKSFLEGYTKSNFDTFFKDWITNAKTIPFISYKYNIQKLKNSMYSIELNLEQFSSEKYIFNLPIEILFSDNNNSLIKSFNFSTKNFNFKAEINFFPKKIIIDPYNKILCNIKRL
jgi:aminopeptidase N